MKTIYKDLSSYDSLLAYKLSIICKNIYYNKDTFLNGLKNFGFTSCEYIEKKNIELFLGYRDNFIIIVFSWYGFCEGLVDQYKNYRNERTSISWKSA